MNSVKGLFLKQLLDIGLIVSINSDDAAYNRAYIGDNFYLCMKELNLTLPDLVKLAKNSFLMAFIEDSERSLYLQRLDDFIKDLI